MILAGSSILINTIDAISIILGLNLSHFVDKKNEMFLQLIISFRIELLQQIPGGEHRIAMENRKENTAESG